MMFYKTLLLAVSAISAILHLPMRKKSSSEQLNIIHDSFKAYNKTFSYSMISYYYYTLQESQIIHRRLKI